MFQLSSGLNFKSVLNFIHTFSTIQDQIVNCLFQIIAIEKSSLIVLVHSLSFVFFCTCVRCHFILDVVFIYWDKHF